MTQLELFPNNKLEFILGLTTAQVVLIKGTDPNLYYTLIEIRKEAGRLRSMQRYHEHKLATAQESMKRLIN